MATHFAAHASSLIRMTRTGAFAVVRSLEISFVRFFMSFTLLGAQQSTVILRPAPEPGCDR